jgi:transposase-like protein
MNLSEIYKRFPTEEDCIKFLEEIRWKGNPVCPYCGVGYFTALQNENRYHCNNCNTSFSVTTRTIFHRSHLPSQKWFYSIYIIVNSHKRISVRELAKEIKVNKDTACLVIQKIRQGIFNDKALLFKIAEINKIS